MDYSTPIFPVLHDLAEFAQTHVHWIDDAIQTSYSLSPPSPFVLNFSRIRAFSNGSTLFIRWPNIGASALTSILPMNSQGWSPLGLTVLISLPSKGHSRVSPAPPFKSNNSSVLSLLYDPTVIAIHDYWKNHSFVYTDTCSNKVTHLVPGGVWLPERPSHD